MFDEHEVLPVDERERLGKMLRRERIAQIHEHDEESPLLVSRCRSAIMSCSKSGATDFGSSV